MRNNFKKFAAIALALVMCVSTLVPVFAADVVCPGKDAVHTATNCAYTVIGTTEADCDNNGAVTGRCNACTAVFAVSTTPALGHKYEVKEGDCTTGTRQVCATCGDVKTSSAVVAGHKFDIYTVEGGECEIGATVTKTCSVCGATKQDTMDYEHNWVLVSMTEPADCLTKGTATYKCGTTGCDATQTREVWDNNVQNHAWSALSTDSYKTYEDILTSEDCLLAKKNAAANCNTVGYIAEFCTACGETRLRELAKTPHQFVADGKDVTKNETAWINWIGAQDSTEWAYAPTCEDKGFKPYVECSVSGCKAVKTLSVAYGYFADGDNGYNGVMTWATDALTGKTPAEMDKDEIAAITIVTTKLADYQLAASHVIVNAVNGTTKAPTCTVKGQYDVACDNGCNYKETIRLAKLGHAYLFDLSEDDQEIWLEARGADLEDYAKVTTEQSCEDEEITTYYCLNGCGEVKEVETKDKLEHVAATAYGYASVAPTCDDEGVKITVCKYCGYEMAEEVIPALGHDLSVQVIVDRPTHEDDGTFKYVCANADFFELYGQKYKSADVTEGTEYWYTTTGCDCEEVDDNDGELYIIDKTDAHFYVRDCWACVDGTNCDICGKTGVLAMDDPNAIVECGGVTGIDFESTETTTTVEFKCLDCDKVQNKTVTKIAHKWYEVTLENELLGNVVSAKMGTCSAPRVWNAYCEYCFGFDTEAKTKTIYDESVFNQGHNKVIVDAKIEPTCTEEGKEATWYCDNWFCEDNLGDENNPLGGGEVIPALHVDVNVAKLITTAVNKLKDYKAPSAANSDFAVPADAWRNPGAKAIQNYQTWTTYLKADDVAKKDQADRTYLKEIALNDYLTFVFAVPGTCTTAPVYGGVKCSLCNASSHAVGEGFLPAVENVVNEYMEPAVMGHDFDDVETVNAVACEDASYTVKTCTVCEQFFLLNYDKGEHNYKAVPDDKVAATCVLEGYETYSCQDCDYVKVVTIEALGHVTDPGSTGRSEVITDTCLDRTVDRFCGVCKQTIAKSHRFGEAVVVDGVETITCVDCGVVETKNVAPETEAPVTDAPVTDAPVVDEPATDAPETDAPVVDEPAKKGCGSSIAAIGVALVATLGTCAVFCGKKED